jgi:hypothetical protein
MLIGGTANILLIVLGIILFPKSWSEDGLISYAAAIVIVLIYIAVTMFGPLALSKLEADTLRTGVTFGFIIAIVFVIAILIGNLLWITESQNGLLGLVEFGPLPLLWGIAGSVGTLRTGHIREGVKAAVWATMISSLIWFVAILSVYYLTLGSPLQKHALEADRMVVDFQRSGMSDYRAFIMQDYLGGGFFHLLLSPILAAGFGVIGAGIASLLPSRTTDSAGVG